MMVQQYVDILQADPWVWNFLCVTAGMFINTIKVCRERDRSILTYWSAHPSRSTLSVLSVYGSYVALMITNAASAPAEFLALGYMLDSMVNRAPESKDFKAMREELADIKKCAPDCEEAHDHVT